MRVALIFPKLNDSVDKFDESFWLTDKVKQLLHLGKTNYTPPLSLLMLTAVTPDDVTVEIVDERIEPIDYEMDVDLVGITVVTRAAYRAYAVADYLRARGVTVVLGGIHPTLLPDEALQHADAVVQGEGEQVWPLLLEDFSKGLLKAIYRGGYNSSIEHLPIPRRDLLKHPEYYLTTKVITASRGCINTCTFCSAGSAIGKKYRTRRIEQIIEELSSIPGRYVVFLDDNLGWDIEFAKRLFQALKALQIQWAGAISLPALEDEELVRLAADSGCISLGVGFESLSRETLKLMGKSRTNNPDQYVPVIRRLHEYGIPILGYFILGYDSDDGETYQRLADFIEKNSIEMPSINTLIPYPGTPIFRYFEREGRLLHRNWNEYDTAGGFVVYRPKNFTPDELFESYLSLTERVYSYRSVVSRLLRLGYFEPLPLAWSFHYNYQQKQSVALERRDYERTHARGA